MINFDKISLKQILIFCKVLKLSSSFDMRTIKRWYDAESINFIETLFLLKSLRLITLKDGLILSSQSLKEAINSDKALKALLINVLLRKNNKVSNFILDFFTDFEPYGNYFRLTPTLQKRLKHSGIRNFLIELGVLRFMSNSGSYFMVKNLFSRLTSGNTIFSPIEFVKKIKAEGDLGYAAEVFVYEQEKDKFHNEPSIQEKIQHVSLENVMVGYDIKSFDKNKNGNPVPKYIEVKAVSEDDWKFYWSRNEIDKSKQLGKNYYLYLIPIGENSKIQTNLIKIIKDPYVNVYENKGWKKEYELISFSQ